MKAQQLQKIKKQLEITQKQYDKAINDRDKSDVHAKNDLKQIARTGITHYYESYEPEYYDREYDLFNIFNIEITENKISINYDYNLLSKHPFKKRKYLFDYMFMQGYHGGDIRGYNHPAPGIPWYRGTASESNTFAFWTVPAVQTDAPYDEIEIKSQKYIDKIVKDYNKDIINPLNKQISKLVNMMK